MLPWPTESCVSSSLNCISVALSWPCVFSSGLFTFTVTSTSCTVLSANVTFIFAVFVSAVEVSTVPTNSAFASVGRFSNAERGSAFSPTFTLISLTFNTTFSSGFEDCSDCVEAFSLVCEFVSVCGAVCCSAASFFSAFGVVIAVCGLAESLLVVTKDPVDLSNLTCTSSFDASCVAFEVVWASAYACCPPSAIGIDNAATNSFFFFIFTPCYYILLQILYWNSTYVCFFDIIIRLCWEKSPSVSLILLSSHMG